MIVHLLFPEARRRAGMTIEVAKRAVEQHGYRALEVADVGSAAERRSLAHLADKSDVAIVYWVSLQQMELGKSIAAAEESERCAAVLQLAGNFPHAAECGAQRIGLISGPDPGPSGRAAARISLQRSLQELWPLAIANGISAFELESMDRDVHKRQLLGPTPETVQFIDDLRMLGVGLSLVFDTAHIRLLGEDIFSSLELAAPLTRHVHLSNCVDDPGSPLFGDNHIPPGEPGFLVSDVAANIVASGRDRGILAAGDCIVSMEVAGRGGDDSWTIEAQARRFLAQALASGLHS